MGKIKIDLDGNAPAQLQKVSELIFSINSMLENMEKRSKNALDVNPDKLKAYEANIKKGIKGSKPPIASSSDMEAIKGFDFKVFDKAKKQLEDLEKLISKGIVPDKASFGAGKNVKVYREELSDVASKAGKASKDAYANKYGESLEGFKEISRVIETLLRNAKHDNRILRPSRLKEGDEERPSRKEKPKDGDKPEPSKTEPPRPGIRTEIPAVSEADKVSMKDVFDDAGEALSRKVEGADVEGAVSEAVKSAVTGSVRISPPEQQGKNSPSESVPSDNRTGSGPDLGGPSGGAMVSEMETLSDAEAEMLLGLEERMASSSQGIKSFGGVLDEVFYRLPKSKEDFSDMIGTVGSALSNFIDNIKDKAANMFGRSDSFDPDAPLDPIEAQPLPGAELPQASAPSFQSFEEEFQRLNALADGIQHPVDEAINGILGDIESLSSGIQKPVEEAANEIRNNLAALPSDTQGLDGIMERLSALPNEVQKPLSDAWENIQYSLDRYSQDAEKPMDEVVNEVLGSFGTLSNEIMKPLDELAEETKNILSTLPDEVQKPAEEAVNGIVGRLSALSDEIQKPLNALADESLNNLTLLPGQGDGTERSSLALERIIDEMDSGSGNPPPERLTGSPEDMAEDALSRIVSAYESEIGNLSEAVAGDVEARISGDGGEREADRSNPAEEAVSSITESEAAAASSMENLNSVAGEIRDAIRNGNGRAESEGRRSGSDGNAGSGGNGSGSNGSGRRRSGTVRVNGQQIPLSAYDNNPELREAFMRGVNGNTSYGRISRSAEMNTRMRQEEQDLRMANMAARVGGGNSSMQYMNPNGDKSFFRNLVAASAGSFSSGHWNFNLGQIMSQTFANTLSAKNFNHAMNKHGLDMADTWKTDAVWEGDEFKEALKQTQAFADLLAKVNSELEDGEEQLSDDDLYAKLKNREIGRSELTSRLSGEDIKKLQGNLTRDGRKNLLERIRNNDSDRAIVAGGLARNNAGKGILGGIAGIAKFAGPIGMAVSGVVKMGEAVVDLGKKSVEAYGQVQSLQTQLGVVFGSQSASSSMFQEIEAYAKKSPFGVAEMTQGAIGLKQSGVYGADLMDTLKSIGDLSSGNKEKFKSITDVYSRVMASTTVTARDMRQLANAGVASYSALSKATGIDRSEIRSQLQAGNIKSVDFQKMVEMLTTNGGMFEGATKKGAATIEARKQNLQDAKQMAMSEMGRWITNLGFDGESSVFSKLLGVAESINQNIEEHFKKVNDKKDSEAAEKAEKKYAELIKKANEAESKGNYSESDKLFEEANTILNGDAWSKTAEANIARYERSKARLEKGGLSIYSTQDLDRGDLGTWWGDFKKKRDEILSELLNDFNKEQEAIEFGINDMGLSPKETRENRQSVLNAYAESEARKQLEGQFAFAGQDFDFGKMWAAFHDAAGNEISDREAYYAEKAGTTIDGENAVSIAQDASVQMAGYMHDANEVFSKGFAWIDAQTQAVDKWVNITTKGVGDLEAAQNRMNSAQTDWVQNSPLAQMMSRDEKARRDEVLKGRITEMADKTYNKDTGNYEFGGLDITEFVEAEKLLTATAEEMSFEFTTLTKQIDDGFGNTKTVISEQGAETLETFRANLNEYYESLLNSNPTEYLDNDTLDHFKSLWEGLAGDISQFDETKITEIGKLINVIGESLEKAASSGDERAQAALTGYKNTGTKMTRDASKAQYLNKRKQADLWAQILSQATGVDASRVQLSGQKAVMDAYTKNFARRDMFSTLGKSLMKNGASLKELSDILKKNSEGMSGGKGMFDWVSASREAEELAAKRNVETQDALIAAYQQQIDALSDLEMAGVATRDTWDNLTSLSAQLGTGFTLAAQEMADGTYRFTEETIRSAEKMKRELDMRKVVQQMDSIFNRRIQELNQSTGEAHLNTGVLGKFSYTVEQAGEYSSLLNQVAEVFVTSDKETVAELIKNNDSQGEIFNILNSLVKNGLSIDMEKLNQSTEKSYEVQLDSKNGSTPVANGNINEETLKKNGIFVSDITKDYLTNKGIIKNLDTISDSEERKKYESWKKQRGNNSKAEHDYIKMLIDNNVGGIVESALKEWVDPQKTQNYKKLDKILRERGLDNETVNALRYSVTGKGFTSSIPWKIPGGTETRTETDEKAVLEVEQEKNKLSSGLDNLAKAIKEGTIETDDEINNLIKLLNLIYPDFGTKAKATVEALDKNTLAINKKSAKTETGKIVDQITNYRKMLGWDTNASKEAMEARAYNEMEDWAPTRNHINWAWEDTALEWLGLPTDVDFKETMGRISGYFSGGSIAKSNNDKEIADFTNRIAELYKEGYEANKADIETYKNAIDTKTKDNIDKSEDRTRYNQMVGSYLQHNIGSILFGQDTKISSLLASTAIPKDLTEDYKTYSDATKEFEAAVKEFNETLMKSLSDGNIDAKEQEVLTKLLSDKNGKEETLNALKNPDTEDIFAARYAAEGKASALGELRETVPKMVDTDGLVDESMLERVIDLMTELGLVTEDAAQAFKDLAKEAVNETLGTEMAKQAMEDFGNEVKEALKAAPGDALLTTTKKLGENFYKMENSLMTQEECAEDIKKSLAGQAAALLETISKSAVDAGLKLIGAGAMENNWGMIAAGLGLAAAGGFGGIASGLLSGYANDSSKDEAEEKMRRLEALKNNLADLLKQARDDAEYYEVNLRNKRAISTNEEVSSLKVTKTNDMILSPNGVFSTAPDDYIFAMKDPASLTRGNGGDVSVNFSIVNQSGTPLNVSQSRRSYNRDTGQLDLEVVVNGIVRKSMMDGDYDDVLAGRDLAREGTPSYA